MSPGKYSKGAPGATVYHAVAQCGLGWLLVAATRLGVCSVKLGDDSPQLVEELRKEFPAAVHQEDREQLESWVIAVLEYLEGRHPALDLPLDVRATAFQRRVWQLLQTIPYGETRTYQEVAQEMGLENSSRAVGRACASNPTALIVPCHRVLRRAARWAATAGDWTGKKLYWRWSAKAGRYRSS
jgi:AraC family transcriptional regulator of adaptative response/methylated-DNA-[protein]-cysteine methyltransferase